MKHIIPPPKPFVFARQRMLSGLANDILYIFVRRGLQLLM